MADKQKQFWRGVELCVKEELAQCQSLLNHFEITGNWPNEVEKENQDHKYWTDYRNFLHWYLRKMAKEMLDLGLLG